MPQRLVGALIVCFGGLAWIWSALGYAAKPYGDTASVRVLRPAERLSTTYRSGDDVWPILFAGIVAILAGLALLYLRRAWREGAWARAATVLLALGALVVAPWPLLLVGFFGLVLGLLASGIAGLRTGLFPRAESIAFLVAAVLLLLFNTEDDRALLFIPAGLLWIWLGLRALLIERAPAVG